MSKVYGKDFSTDKEETVREQILDMVDDAMTNIFDAMDSDVDADPSDVAIVDQFVKDLMPWTEEGERDTLFW